MLCAASRRPRRPAGASPRSSMNVRDPARTHSSSASLLTGFSRYAIAPALSPCCRSLDSGDDVHRDVPRLRMVLEPVEHRPAVHPRHVDVERDRVGLDTRAPAARPASPSSATSPLKPFSRAMSSRTFAKFASFSMMSTVRSPGSIVSRSSSKPSGLRQRVARHRHVVLVAGVDGATAVAPPTRRQPLSATRADGAAARRRRDARPMPLRRPRLAAGAATPQSRRRRRARCVARRLRIDVPRRQEERERAALARRALDADLAAEQRAISRLIDSPRPVPPNLRLVVPSACWNASKISCCLSFAMPMPVSVTANAITVSALVERSRFANRLPFSAARIVSVTPPCSVNLNAFESRFLSTCCSRWPSV